jgi:hypothetical protein
MTTVPPVVLADTKNLRLRESLLLGSALEGGWGPRFPVGDQGTSFGPFQMHEGGMLTSLGGTPRQAEDPKWAVKAILPTYASAVNAISNQKWQQDPEGAAEQAAVIAERPAQDYFAARGTSTVNQAWAATRKQLAGKHSQGGMPPQSANLTSAGNAGGFGLFGNLFGFLGSLFGIGSGSFNLKSDLERIGLVVGGFLLVLIGLLMLTLPTGKAVVAGTAGEVAGVRRAGRAFSGGGGGSGNVRDEADIARRQAIADRSLELGERKLELQRMREERLRGNIV